VGPQLVLRARHDPPQQRLDPGPGPCPRHHPRTDRLHLRGARPCDRGGDDPLRSPGGDHAVTFPACEAHVGLWRDRLASWMPDRLFDAHIHLGAAETVGPISGARQREGLTTFTHLTREAADAYHRGLFPGKRVEGMFAFGFPLRENDLPRANTYLAQCAAD